MKTKEKIFYAMTEENVMAGSKEVCEYGISVCDEAGNRLFEFTGITSDREELEELIRKIERNDLSPVHIRDVIEDFVVERS